MESTYFLFTINPALCRFYHSFGARCSYERNVAFANEIGIAFESDLASLERSTRGLNQISMFVQDSLAGTKRNQIVSTQAIDKAVQEIESGVFIFSDCLYLAKSSPDSMRCACRGVTGPVSLQLACRVSVRCPALNMNWICTMFTCRI
jgi:hypothetical protein